MDIPSTSQTPVTSLPIRGRRGRGRRGGVTDRLTSEQATTPSDDQGPIRARGRGRGRGRGKRTAAGGTSSPKPPSKKRAAKVNPANYPSQPSTSTKADTQPNDSVEVCPICLDPPVHETSLECGHKYCFLCAKGLSEGTLNPACSMCRRPISPGFFLSPKLTKRKSLQAGASTSNSSTSSASPNFCWFYEGGQGWWRFEERHSEEIEAAFQAGRQFVELLICGQLYFINLLAMAQFKKQFPTRVRRIKRDLSDAQSVGIAGLSAD